MGLGAPVHSGGAVNQLLCWLWADQVPGLATSLFGDPDYPDLLQTELPGAAGTALVCRVEQLAGIAPLALQGGTQASKT